MSNNFRIDGDKTEDGQMDRGFVCSNADFHPVCCGGERAKLLIYWSIFVMILIYGHDKCIITKRTTFWIQAFEMSFLWRVAGDLLIKNLFPDFFFIFFTQIQKHKLREQAEKQLGWKRGNDRLHSWMEIIQLLFSLYKLYMNFTPETTIWIKPTSLLNKIKCLEKQL